MDSSGRPTAMSEKFQNKARPRAAAARALAALCLAALLAAGGCAMPVFKAGKPPPVDRLAQLKVAVSTTEEVRAALGEPQGRGAVRLPQTGLQEIWLYEYDVVAHVQRDQSCAVYPDSLRSRKRWQSHDEPDLQRRGAHADWFWKDDRNH